MKDQSLVSIIIPIYNREKLISATLDSVIDQTYSNWECIVIDDGSTDKTIELVQAYADKDDRIKIYRRSSNYGAGGNGARNYGYELSKGGYINWFDSDDIMLPNFIQTKMEMFQEQNIQFVITGGHFWDGKEINKPMKIHETDDFYADFQTWALNLTTNCVLFRRGFLENKELFSEQMYRAQETEFFSRIFFKVPDNIYMISSEPTFLYRQHIDSITQKTNSYNKKFLISRVKLHLDNLDRSVELRHEKLISHHYKGLISEFLKALENNDTENVNNIKNKGYIKLREINTFAASLFILLCNILIRTKKMQNIPKGLLYRLNLLIK
ncbi:MAG: glycosyltransferase family 2 protein [Chryseobacterium sp.]|nr:glycosyltransferase family 2 protein [Chryseobacterium sp.]